MPSGCHWSRLPTEIRIQIYKYLVPEKHAFIIAYEERRVIVAKDHHQKNKRVSECIATALFYVNKQISHETRELLFAANTFVLRAGVWVGDLGYSLYVDHSVGLCQVIRVLTVETLLSIRHLKIQI